VRNSRPSVPVALTSPPTRGALAALALAMLLSSLGTSIANVGLPDVARDFGASFQAVQWVVIAYLLAVTTLVVTMGRAGDQFGRRTLLLSGVALFTVASALCATATTLSALIASRAVQGTGAALMMALTHALVSDIMPATHTGRAMGWLGTMSAAGTALGPSLGGLLLATFGWRALFMVTVPIGLVTMVLAYRQLPRDARATRGAPRSFDMAGTTLLAITLASYALSVTWGRGHFLARQLALLVTAGLAFAALLQVERTARDPLVRLASLRDVALRASLIMSALVSTVMMATLVVGPFYLAHALGLESHAVGLVMSVGPVVTALTGVPAGQLADRTGAPRMMMLGLTLMFAGALMLAAQPRAAGVPGYALAIACMAAGYGAFQTANNLAVMSGIESGARGVTSALLTLSRNLGLITGASVMAALFAVGAGVPDITLASAAATSQGMRMTFAAAAVTIVAALVVACLAVWRTPRSSPANPAARTHSGSLAR
jgi:MFS family permease